MLHKHAILSGLQSAIKMIRLIILAAVRKGYKHHLQDPLSSWENFFMFTDMT